jgi:hypothetical protein
MIIKAKALEIGKFILKCIWAYLFQLTFKCAFDLENHELKNIIFNKSYLFLCYLGHGCIIYKWYRPRYSKKWLYSKHNRKLGMKNVEIKKIDQHKNATCVKCNPWKGF